MLRTKLLCCKIVTAFAIPEDSLQQSLYRCSQHNWNLLSGKILELENYIWIFIGINLFRMQIRAALNQQTAVQFAQYAQQQCPNNKQQVSHTKLSQYIIIVYC